MRTLRQTTYLLLSLPLGVVWFTVVVCAVAVPAAFLGAPLWAGDWPDGTDVPFEATIAAFLIGIPMAWGALHLVRGAGSLATAWSKLLLDRP
jgi:hypothetical protein